MLSKKVFFAAVFIMPGTVAFAQDSAAPQNGVLEQKNLSLTLANGLATAALNACAEINQTAVVAVVDRGGNLVAVQREDNVGPHNTSAAQRRRSPPYRQKVKLVISPKSPAMIRHRRI